MTCVSATTDYDPRHERAQTLDGAKARYVSDSVEYSLANFERDVERILVEGEHPDRPRDRPLLGGQVVYS
jgi:hypothetical protein